MQHIPPANLGEKTKIFVCGPPGQVAALAGKKEGMKQGALSGVLKDAGFTEDQVRRVLLCASSVVMGLTVCAGVQVLER